MRFRLRPSRDLLYAPIVLECIILMPDPLTNLPVPVTMKYASSIDRPHREMIDAIGEKLALHLVGSSHEQPLPTGANGEREGRRFGVGSDIASENRGVYRDDRRALRADPKTPRATRAEIRGAKSSRSPTDQFSGRLSSLRRHGAKIHRPRADGDQDRQVSYRNEQGMQP
jgi:hypothetical protein